MNPEAIFGGTLLMGAAVGLVAALWSKLKSAAWRVASLFVVRFTVDDQASSAVGAWLWRHGKRSRFGERAYDGSGLYVKPADRQLVVAWEKVGCDPGVFWVGNRPVLVGIEAQMQGGTNMGGKLTLTFLRGLFDPDRLVRAAVDEYNARRHGDGVKRFAVQRVVGRSGKNRGGGRDQVDQSPDSPTAVERSHPSGDVCDRRYLGWSESDVGPPSPPDPLGPLAFPPEVDAVVEEARRWLASERWYKSRRIPWRLGWLFYGQPGTGKTSLARAVAVELDLKVFAFELATLDDGELIRWWREALAETPCMVLLEDIDAVFKGRENRTGEKGSGLSFGCLLNCISGVEGADGVLLAVTTNRVEDIDPALGVPDTTYAGGEMSTRPGRIDRAVELRAMDADCRRRVASRILADCPGAVEPVVAAGDGDSGAQFQDRCTRIALAHFWGGRRPADA